MKAMEKVLFYKEIILLVYFSMICVYTFIGVCTHYVCYWFSDIRQTKLQEKIRASIKESTHIPNIVKYCFKIALIFFVKWY